MARLFRPVTRVTATYAVNGSPCRPMARSATIFVWTVCPCAACAVIAKAGANGNCLRVMRSIGFFRCLSRCHCLRCAATGYTFACSNGGMVQATDVWNRTYMAAGNVFQMPVVTSVSASGAQPTTTPRQPRKIPRLRSRWPVARTGMPTHSGNMPYKLPQSWSCRCSHSTFSACRSGFSRNAAAEIRSWAMAYRRPSPCCFAHSSARILFT